MVSRPTPRLSALPGNGSNNNFPASPSNLSWTTFSNLFSNTSGADGHGNLFRSAIPEAYDFVIANPPYVRTQIMGAKQAQLLSEQFGLSGRIDLYYAFVLGISQVLKPQGIAGIIVSNRFMTTKSGASIRQALFDRFNIHHAWDLGDTKLFAAAVLPAVLLVKGKNGHKLETPAFTSIYQTSEPAARSATDPITALNEEGVIEIDDGRHFRVQHGKLDTNGIPDGIWRLATEAGDTWLRTVEAHSWGTFRDIGKIRVGVKTCADKIFIRNDWHDMTELDRPELLRPLTTHHIARRFKSLSSNRPSQILYPHEVVGGRRRAIHLERYPRSHAYLAAHRLTLEGRKIRHQGGPRMVRNLGPTRPERLGPTQARVPGYCGTANILDRSRWLHCEPGIAIGLSPRARPMWTFSGSRPPSLILLLSSASTTSAFTTSSMRAADVSSLSTLRNFPFPIRIAPLVSPSLPKRSGYTRLRPPHSQSCCSRSSTLWSGKLLPAMLSEQVSPLSFSIEEVWR